MNFEKDFEKIFNRLQSKLSDEDLTQGKILIELERSPYDLMVAAQLLVFARKKYKELELNYKVWYSSSAVSAIKALEYKKSNKMFSKQITNETIEQYIIQSKEDEFKSFNNKINEAKSKFMLCEYLVKAFEQRISSLQSINKKIHETNYSEKYFDDEEKELKKSSSIKKRRRIKHE